MATDNPQPKDNQQPQKHYNKWLFTDGDKETDVAIALTADGSWTFRAGTTPDVNSAIVSYKEFDKLLVGGLSSHRKGDVELYCTDPDVPDVTLYNQYIIDVEPVLSGVVLKNDGSQEKRIVEYRLWFADWRSTFVFPRGGRLFDGDINTFPPKQTDGDGTSDDSSSGDTPSGDDSGDSDVGDDVPQIQNSELMTRCIRAIGFSQDTGPTTADEISPLCNLQWYGAHPGEELSKLLSHTGHAFGTNILDRLIYKIGDDDEPTFPEGTELPALELKGITRAGKTCILISAPMPILDTFDSSDESTDTDPPQWHFVLFDKNSGWALLDSLDDFPGTPEQAVRAKFQNVLPSRKKAIEQGAYHFLQLDVDLYPPDKCAVHRKKHSAKVTQSDSSDESSKKDLKIYRSDPVVTAKIARQLPDGSWKNTDDPVEIKVDWLGDSNIIHCTERLGLIDSDNAVSDADASFKAIDPQDIKVTFSVEGIDAQLQTKLYFVAGFKKDVSDTNNSNGSGGSEEDGPSDADDQDSDDGLTALTDEEARTIVAVGGGDDVVIISMPELFYVRKDGKDDDGIKSHLTSLARAKAKQILAASGQTYKVRTAVGFHPININGKVNEVVFNQEAVTTTVKINGWWLPSTALRKDDLDRIKTGNYPGQHTAHASQSFHGGSGEQQPAVPISPPQPSQQFAGTQLVYVVSNIVGGGRYTANIMTETTGAFPDGTVGVATLGDYSHGQEVALVNLLEINANFHSLADVASSRVVGAWPSPSGRKDGAGRPIYFCLARAGKADC